MSLESYARKALQTQPGKVSQAQMIVCGAAACFPLLIGLYFNELHFAIFGSLIAYLLTVFEQVGTLTHRLFVTSLTFGLLLFGFYVGLNLPPHGVEFYLVLAALSYWVGVLGGEGAELERGVLFATLQMIIAHSAAGLVGTDFTLLFKYIAVGFLFVLVATIIHVLFFLNEKSANRSVLESLKKTVKRPRHLHLHAMSYTLTALVTALVMSQFHVQRGYWTLITVMLVMKPDRTESLLRCFQRLLGTCVGVGLATALVMVVHSEAAIIFLVAAFAYFVPWALKRNYWLVSFGISVIVILLLELPTIQNVDLATPLLRLEATALGSAFGIAGILISKLLSSLADLKIGRRAQGR